ncbi:MAG TPA: protein-methionine-sulfoxide reductase catalytic subunit MsrP [Polyangia bacterium]
MTSFSTSRWGSRSRPGQDIPAREITPEALYHRRREFLRGGAAAAVGGAFWLGRGRDALALSEKDLTALPNVKPNSFKIDEEKTPFKDVASYNNFYEFGTAKSDPAANAHTLKTRPWTVACEGEIKKPETIDIDRLLKLFPLEERVYRFRCVEAWSMVIPWVGFPLASLLKRLEPTSKAKYVAFTTLADSAQMPGIRRDILDWPYVEGLRIDEAMHPLTILAVGLYGRVLPNQNGAPVRLVVPWKYGFKSIKSIVKIRLVENQPPTSWNISAPNEYGFYSNVNPEVDHPRWSQARERRIGEFLKRKTLPWNGYPEVAGLYQGMDLRKFF